MQSTSLLFKDKHLSTIIPSLFRKNFKCNYSRERVTTLDGDFFDIDWVHNKSDKLIILIHGLEGSSDQHYIKSQAHLFSQNGFDICAFNFRSCSGQMNKTMSLYHSGATDDLELLLSKIQSEKKYKEIHLIGFSLGGNVILKYLGEKPRVGITSACTFSVPIDLEACSYQLARGFNRLYSYIFMRTLRVKVKHIQKQFKENKIANLDPKILKTFLEFDEFVTAPLHGFKNAKDYWTQSSSKQFLKFINIPTLLVNAKNDPFLAKECYPNPQEIGNSNLQLEYPNFGGHVGFVEKSLNKYCWMDRRALEFVKSI